MSVEQQLQPGEEIVYRAHPTRVLLLPRAALAAVAAVAALVLLRLHQPPYSTAGAGLLGVVALGLALTALWRLLLLRAYEYALTTHRVIRQVGLFAKSSMDSRLDKINNVEHRQTLWGRLLSYGDVEIDTASEVGTVVFPGISHPLDFKRAILTAVEDYRNRPLRAAAPAAVSPAEKIRQLKGLLDEGLISPQEFEAKRRQLLEEM